MTDTPAEAPARDLKKLELREGWLDDVIADAQHAPEAIITRLTAEVERLKQEHANATIVIRVSNNAHAETIAENARLTAEVERLRDMVRRAYNDGFGEGIKEHTTHKGGTPWQLSKWPAALKEPRT